MAPLVRLEKRAQDLFMLGMFSVIDAMMDRPMVEILGEIAIDKEVKDALLGEPGKLCDMLACAIAYERAAWSEVTELATKLGIVESSLPDVYLESIDWVAKLLDAGGR